MTSPEWFHAKALETFEEAPHVFAAAGRFLEAGDWLVWQLTGREARSACQAGFKAHYHNGYPPAAELERLAPGFSALNRMLAPPHPVGTNAGDLSADWARRTGLRAGTPVGVAVIDAHAAVPGLGVIGPGVLVAAMGTSTCHILLADSANPARGIAGVVHDGVYPGLYAYETGQAAAGDMLAWWVRMTTGGLPDDPYRTLDADAEQLPPGGYGLLALDWWNGSRTPLMDARLSGVLFGLRVDTRPAEVYRALLEATAFGNRQVLDLLERQVGPIREVRLSGGLTKSRVLMQMLADVLNREVLVASTPHASARGAAIYGALAADCGSIADVCTRMSIRDFTRYHPDPARVQDYRHLFDLYREAHRYLGEGGTDLLRQLRR
jgi:L-ribulokinase